MLAILSLWIARRYWVWGALVVLSFVFAIISKTATYETLIPLGVLLGCHVALHFQIKGVIRYLALIVAAILSFGLAFHLIPGFDNWRLANQVSLSTDSMPFTYYWNFDKPFIGLFVIALNLPLIQTRESLKGVFLKTLPFMVLGVGALLALSYWWDVVQFDLKWTALFFIWPIGNLFLTVIPEEAFFRGFLQTEIAKLIPHKRAGWISILTVSVVFALLHFNFVSHLSFIAIAFFASLLYGTCYYLTESIESSILTHYFLNLVHFVFLTYPALQN